MEKQRKISIVSLTENTMQDFTILFDKYRQFYKQSTDLDGAHNFLQERFKKNESVVFLALFAKETAGFVQLYPSFTSIGMARTWILNDIFVDGEYRRLGVAEKLITHVFQFAKESGAKKVRLETYMHNIQAQALYKKTGFTKENSIYNYDYNLE